MTFDHELIANIDTNTTTFKEASNPGKQNTRSRLEARGLNQQMNALSELRSFSLPQGAKVEDTLSYAYEDETPGHVRLYIVDTGADTTSRVSCLSTFFSKSMAYFP